MNAVAGILAGLAMLAIVAAGIWWLVQRPMFSLTAIRIEGLGGENLRHVNAATVKVAAIPRLKGNFFTANLDDVRLAFETVPWVRRAAVRRVWPNGLVVSVEEHVALGTWGEDGRLLSAKGDVFTANLAEAEEDAALLGFSGPEGSEKDVLARYRDLRDWLAPANLQPEAVQLSSRYAWTVKLSNGVAVELGREQSSTTLRERVDRLLGVYPQLAERWANRIENVDMRYPNGLALRTAGLALDK
jgi:cell division protein FtsQ